MLNPAQLASLKAAILADSSLNSQPNNPDGNLAIVQAMAADASPDYWVWKTFVPDQEIYSAVSPAGTSWSWTEYIARSQGEREAWRQMVNMAGGLNPSLANVRAGVADIFSGGSGAKQRAFLLALSRRKANRAEKLFAAATAGGSGSRGSTGNPDTLTVEGTLSVDDVQAARNLP